MMDHSAFPRFGGLMAILAGVAGFVYAIGFVVLQNVLLYSVALLLIGVFSTAALVAVYARVKDTDPSFALWGLIMGLVGGVGSAIHGGYDLANAINLPESLPAAVANLPSQIDPRGLSTFGFSGIAVFVMAWLIVRGGAFPKGVGYLGYLSALLLAVLYLGRLIVLSPTSPVILVPALLSGFIVNPAWYVWLGVELSRSA
jgi:hypothetical protein